MSSLQLVGAGAVLVLLSLVQRPQSLNGGATSAPAGRRWARRIFLTIGGLLCLVGLAYLGLAQYLTWREAVSPSAEQMLVLKDGRRVPMSRPLEAQPASAEPAGATVGERSSVLPPVAPASLPPTRIRLPRIGLDSPVVLSDVDTLPRFQAVAWILGSAFPGERGNIVLFGDLDGPYATFTRLGELHPGDEFTLVTAKAEYRYRVTSSRETDADDVAVLAATTTSTATLITDVAGAPDRRRVVTADLVTPRP